MRAIRITSYHGIGWDIRPGHGYARKKPDAIKRAREQAAQTGATRIMVYKDNGELQRVIKVKG